MSQDDQFLFWEETVQKTPMGDIQSIVQSLTQRPITATNESNTLVQKTSNIMLLWNQERIKREEDRKLRNKLQFDSSRTQSVPNLKNQREIERIELKADIKIDSFAFHSPKRKKKRPSLDIPPQCLKPFPITIPSQSEATKEEIMKQELQDLMELMDGGDFDDDPFLDQQKDKIVSSRIEYEYDSTSDTEDTNSDVSEESGDESGEWSNPFLLDRTKTTDFIPPIPNEYIPPLRCLVLEVTQDQFSVDEEDIPNLNFDRKQCSTPRGPQKTLRVFDENRVLEKLVFLRGQWEDTNVQIGDYLNIISWSMTMQELIDTPFVLIDNRQNALVLHPDILLPAKPIGSSIRCSRQAVLSQKLRSPPIITEQILVGEIVHLLFERALLHKNFSSVFLETNLLEVMEDNILKIFLLEKDMKYFLALIKPTLHSLQQWAQSNVQGVLVSSNARSTSMMSLQTSGSKPVQKIIAVEESIWSPLYGLKGKIDATVVYKASPLSSHWRNEVSQLSPLELKTGKLRERMGNTYDRAQVSLYALLFLDRLSAEKGKMKPPFPTGLLCYINNGEKSLFPVHATINMIQSLIQRRNDIAIFLNLSQSLPPPIKQENICNYCHQQNACFVYHKVVENGTTRSSGAPALFMKHTQHTTKEHVTYFLLWDKFIELESSFSKSLPSSAFWNFTSTQQAELGLCASNMKLVASSSVTLPTPTPSNSSQQNSSGNDKSSSLLSTRGFLYRFEQQQVISSTNRRHSSLLTSLLELSLSIGDFVLLSTESGHFGIRQGTIKSITDHSMSILLDDALQAPYSQSLSDILSSASQDNSSVIDIEDLVGVNTTPHEHIRWRIDKLDSLTIYGRMRWNLLQLLKDEPHHTKLRELIIERRAPEFRTMEAPCDDFINSWSQQFPSITHLNDHQRIAIKHVLAAKDYALILGMPGTGKTTTIAHIVAALVEQGKRVLLTSYTHSAIDNLLLKLLELNVSFLRLGKANRVHPTIFPYSLQKVSSIKELEQKLSNHVIATTCLGVNDLVLRNTHFDCCIIDEASQISLPACLGPLFFADVFVLVGDHYQLPPIIRSREASENGKYESLFKTLSEIHPASVVHLGIQYRMNKEIMSLSNELVYNQRLLCGSELIADAKLSLPHIAQLPPPIHPELLGNHWLLTVLSPEKPVLFVDTDDLPAPENKKETTITNPIEAQVTAIICRALLISGVKASQIGVISPYRAQLKIIRQEMKVFSGLQKVDVFTVDKYQGKDKEAIIFSLVRNNQKNGVGELLQDWRRANVAFTRAKQKLIILGSSSTLRSNHFFSLFLNHIHAHDWYYKLPPGSHKSYKN